MGIFSGIKNLAGRDFGERLLAAGAIVNGDYGTAGQIRHLGQQRRNDQAEADAKAAQAEQAVAALVRQGIPEADARVIVSQGAADTVLGQRFGQQADNEFTRTLRAAGIDPASEQGQALYRQRAATMASPAPQMTGSPETGYRWNTPPPPQIPGLTTPPPQQPQQSGSLGPQAPQYRQPASQQPLTSEQVRGAVNSLGPQGAAQWLQRNNHIVAVRTPEEARQLPSGTRIRLPDGTEGRVP